MTASRALGNTERDEAFMRRALQLARLGWGQTAPNPMVGAVVVTAGGSAASSAGGSSASSEAQIVGEGHHARYGGDHAEVVALRRAGERARGATLYVTLEPCAHYGKTPPCVHAIARAGIARVVAAVRDPSELAAGGVERLRAAGIQVDLGILRDQALELNAPFFNAHVSALPWVTLKLAMSADGRIAAAGPASRWITGQASRDHVHVMRAGNDAIAVGIGTVLADDPMLTVRDADPPRVAPRRVVFDSDLRIPLTSALVRTAGKGQASRASLVPDADSPSVAEPDHPRTIAVANPSADPERAAALVKAGVTVLYATDLEHALQQLRRNGVRSLLVEGGARLGGALLGADLVSRVVTFRAPIQLGPEALGAWDFAPPDFATRLAATRVAEQREFGDDTMTTYALHPVPCSPA